MKFFSAPELSAPSMMNSRLSFPTTIEELAINVLAKALRKGERFLFGIAGPPAAGKSTLARNLVHLINHFADTDLAIVVPMDGFHRPEEYLRQHGLTAEKGTPRTFDAEAFVALASRLQSYAYTTIFAPEFDHGQQDPKADAIQIKPTHKIIVLEGNYLLLNIEPWDRLRDLLDETCYIDADIELTKPRLMVRHAARGRDHDSVEQKIAGTDFPNHNLISRDAHRATFRLVAREFQTSQQETSIQTDVLGLGASTVDLLVVVNNFPQGRESQEVSQLIIQGGGPVATAMATIARLGGRPAMLDRIGNDHLAELVLREFRDFGVDTSQICRAVGSTSFSSIVVNRSTGDRAIMFQKGTAPELEPEDVEQCDLSGIRLVHVNGRHVRACERLIQRARQEGILVSFDGGAQSYSAMRHHFAASSDICIVAKDFAIRMTEKAEPAAACSALLKLGCKLVGITDGKNGSWLQSVDQPLFHQPAFLQDNTVDTTGCGDAYHGAFLFEYLRGQPLEKCAETASAVASINTQAIGGRGKLPTQFEVQEFLSLRSNRA